MPDLRFDGRVAVVTGRGRGLGRCLRPAARVARREGRRQRPRRRPRRGRRRRRTGRRRGAVRSRRPGDRRSRAPRRSLPAKVATRSSATALEHYGRLDILIHNAGNVRRGSLKEMSYEDFDAVLDVHLRGAFTRCAAGVSGHVRGRLRAHRADFVDRRLVRKPRRGQLRGRQGRRARVVQCRGARRRRRRRDVQRDRAGRGDANGRRASTPRPIRRWVRNSLRPWWVGSHTNPAR